MTGYQIEAYRGSEDYIFVSYAHKDSDKVFPIIKKLIKRGYRIWYDEGITPGSEWSEDIARHLNNSAMVIAFMTPNFVASVNCRREVNFALSKQKPFLSVELEPTKMPLGMEMQLSSQQSVLRYHYATEELFIRKICECPAMGRCGGLPECFDIPEEQEAVQAPSELEDPEILRQQQIKDTVSFWGKIIATVTTGAGAVLLIIVTVLLFMNYHQENLITYTPISQIPEWIEAILPGVWHELPDITSPEYQNLENLPAIAWLIAIGWFLRSIGETFKRHAVAVKMVQIETVLRYAAIAGHIALCACVETSVQMDTPQWDAWLPYYFPMENLVAISIMMLAGYVIGHAANWLIRSVLGFVLKVKM